MWQENGMMKFSQQTSGIFLAISMLGDTLPYASMFTHYVFTLGFHFLALKLITRRVRINDITKTKVNTGSLDPSIRFNCRENRGVWIVEC